DYFAARLAEGIGLLFGIQAIVNMGVDMGVLPTKGLTLPFMSYGGSSTLLSVGVAALLMRIAMESRASGAIP
ncbi:MAG: FtsW/RodA/SpoVE family cell cycle protein, partial [Acidiferrobacteraceae bacterium]